MWLNLNLCGFAFQLNIKSYDPNLEDNGISNWCQTSLLLKFGNVFEYRMDEEEIFLSGEIDYIVCVLDALLKGEIEKDSTIKFVEPDIQLKLFPEHDMRNDPDVVYSIPNTPSRIFLWRCPCTSGTTA